MDDEAWMARLKAGDLGAYVPLYTAHRQWIAAYAGAALRSREAGEEVAQEAFFQVFRRRAQYRGGSFAGWLNAIARNLVRDRQRVRSQVPFDPDPEDHPPDPGPGPALLLERSEMAERVRRALDELEPEERELLYLRSSGDLSYRALSAMTGRSETALRSEVSRTIARLRESLGVHGISARSKR